MTARIKVSEVVRWVEQKHACGVTYGSPTHKGICVASGIASEDSDPKETFGGSVKAGMLFYVVKWEGREGFDLIGDWNHHLQPQREIDAENAARAARRKGNG